MSIETEKKKCPYCFVKDGILRCKKCGNARCNEKNCPHQHISQDDYDDYNR